jgi:transcriptional regulator with PAS, ATPase and Fis domain
MRTLVLQAERVAPTNCTVLLTGETGVGKDVLARFIHSHSDRASKQLISVNCGALTETLFEAEFFGSQKGAYTGAHETRAGLLEAAHDSTLFLDEIGDMPTLMQVKLLRFLEEGTFRRVGSNHDRLVNTRVIAATNKDLQTAIHEGAFRADLYYRLNIISLAVPPLRERREEIPALIEDFLSMFRSRFRRPNLQVSHQARQSLYNYNWPGNIRELRNCLERACALSKEDLIEAEDLITYRIDNLKLISNREPSLATAPSRTLGLASPGTQAQPANSLQTLERAHIMNALTQNKGNRDRAAASLGISSRTLYRKLKQYSQLEQEAPTDVSDERVAC